MATLTIGGQKVQVDDSFLSLPPDQQQKAVDEIAKTLGTTAPQPSAGGASPANAAPSPQAPQPEERGSLIDPIMQGIGFGLPDEAAGIVSGAIDWMGLGPEGDKGTFSGGYDRTTKEWRDDFKAYSDRNPIVSGVAEVGGALATLPVTGAFNIVRAPAAVSRAAPIAARIGNAVARGAATTANSAATGAAYGGLYGFGTAEGGLANRAVGAGEGAAMGAAVGAAAPAVVGAAKGVGRAVGNVLGNPIKTGRGAIAPASEAERRVVAAAKNDGPLPKAVRALEDAADDGVPMAPLDIGETTRALGRSASNTSPAGREALNRMVGDRFATQFERATDVITRNAPGVNSHGQRELLKAAARRANKPLYDKAYMQGERGIWNPEIEQLTLAPAMRSAIKSAKATGANKAAVEGAKPPKNPFVENADGTISMQPGVTPNLRFWDAVKQNLDDQYDKARRAGEKGGAGDILAIKQRLVAELDAAVPAYKQARGTAASFFGADDALTAGEAFVSSRANNAEARKVVAAMKPAERTLFAEGFASKMIADIREIGERRSVITSKIFNSPAAKERLEIALGPQAAREMEAFLYIENIMDMGRMAVQGNSTTARQLAELGIAGGAGLAIGGGDLSNPKTYITALLTGVLLHGGRGKLNAIDAKVAKQVADLLSSQDPKLFKQAVERVGRSPRLLEALGKGHDGVTRALMPTVSKSPPLEITVHPQFTNDGGSQPAQAEGDGN